LCYRFHAGTWLSEIRSAAAVCNSRFFTRPKLFHEAEAFSRGRFVFTSSGVRCAMLICRAWPTPGIAFVCDHALPNYFESVPIRILQAQSFKAFHISHNGLVPPPLLFQRASNFDLSSLLAIEQGFRACPCFSIAQTYASDLIEFIRNAR
jgi:hypothetical protein